MRGQIPVGGEGVGGATQNPLRDSLESSEKVIRLGLRKTVRRKQERHHVVGRRHFESLGKVEGKMEKNKTQNHPAFQDKCISTERNTAACQSVEL